MSELRTATSAATGVTSSTTAAIALPLALVADANPDSRARRTLELEARGFRVTVARTAFEAVVKASCHLPDLIVVDASLEHGADEATELLSTCPATAHIPIVRLREGRGLPRRLRQALKA